jgi:CRP-like cAMP-binding protein
MDNGKKKFSMQSEFDLVESLKDPKNYGRKNLENSEKNIDTKEFKDPSWGAAQLKNIVLFSKLNLDELRDLYSQGKYVSLLPGAHAVIEGEMSRSMYLVLKGSLSVYKNDPVTNSMVRLAVLESGSNFGELSLFDAAPRSATVAALDHCFLFCLENLPFLRFLDKWGAETKVRFYSACAEELAVRFRKLNADYIQSQRLIWRYALRREEKLEPDHGRIDRA